MIQSTCSKKHYDYRDKKFCQVSTGRVLKWLKELEDIRGGRKIAIASMIKGGRGGRCCRVRTYSQSPRGVQGAINAYEAFATGSAHKRCVFGAIFFSSQALPRFLRDLGGRLRITRDNLSLFHGVFERHPRCDKNCTFRSGCDNRLRNAGPERHEGQTGVESCHQKQSAGR